MSADLPVQGSPDLAALGTLPAMLEEMRGAPEIVQPSRFWEHLTELNLQQLQGGGFAEFKRTINRNYFQFQLTSPRSPEYRAVMRDWLRSPSPAPVAARLSERLQVGDGQVSRLRGAINDKAYAVYLALLWEFVRRRDRRGLLDRLQEPLLGRPVHIDYRGRRISEDLCNSVLEFTAIDEGFASGTQIDSVMELGGGYGRLAWVVLSALPGVRYVAVDIPPALAIAERYLTQLFPGRSVFAFRHFDGYEEIAEEMESADIVFLTPNQLELIPPQDVDLFINVSSLHEMRPEQIAHYLTEIDRHCDGRFYSKQWQRSINEHDGLVISHDDYPIPASWRTVYDRPHPVQVKFFEALYAVGVHPGQ